MHPQVAVYLEQAQKLWLQLWGHSEKEYALLNSSAMVLWALLIVWLIFPVLGKSCRALVKLYALVVSVFYAAKFVWVFKDQGKVDFLDFKFVMDMFKDPQTVVLGWSHYVAFDLLVGMMIVEQVARFGVVARLCFLPFLPLIVMAGPIGYLASFVFISVASLSASKPRDKYKLQ
jgi:hypothetical protein